MIPEKNARKRASGTLAEQLFVFVSHVTRALLATSNDRTEVGPTETSCKCTWVL